LAAIAEDVVLTTHSDNNIACLPDSTKTPECWPRRTQPTTLSVRM